MSISWDERNRRYRWSFKATIGGERFRSSKLLPKGWGEAQAKRHDQAETARTYARLSAGRTVLIDQVVALYLEEVIPGQRAGVHAARCLSYLIDYYQGRALSELGDISREYAKAMKGKLAPSTVRQRLSYLRAAANHAQEYHAIGKLEFTAQMTMPAVKNDRHMYLKRAQIIKWARACQYPPGRALILMTFATGSRPGECHQSESVGTGLLLPEDKNGNRILKPVDPKYQRYLRHWPMMHGYSWVSKHVRETRRAIGLGEYVQHDLRHSTASGLISSGATLPEVMAVLDHASAASSKRYQHLYDERKRELIAGLLRQKRGRKSPTRSASG